MGELAPAELPQVGLLRRRAPVPRPSDSAAQTCLTLISPKWRWGESLEVPTGRGGPCPLGSRPGPPPGIDPTPPAPPPRPDASSNANRRPNRPAAPNRALQAKRGRPALGGLLISQARARAVPAPGLPGRPSRTPRTPGRVHPVECAHVQGSKSNEPLSSSTLHPPSWSDLSRRRSRSTTAGS